jgi:hypothetical protein
MEISCHWHALLHVGGPREARMSSKAERAPAPPMPFRSAAGAGDQKNL